MPPIRFRSTHTPRFSELDPNGHVNTKHFFDYIAENRMIGHRRHLGLTLVDLAKLPFAVVTRKFEIELLRPLFLDQEFEVVSWVEEVSSTSATVLAELLVGETKTVAKAKLLLVSVDKNSGRPVDWEPQFIAKFFTSGL